MSIEKEMNHHHLLPKSKGGLTVPLNIKILGTKEHTYLHMWCGNDTPVEQLCRVLLLNEKVWTENFKADLMDVLSNYLNNYYKKQTHSGIIRSEIETVLGLEQTLDKG